MDKLRRALSGEERENQAEQGGITEMMDTSSLSWGTRLQGFAGCFVLGFLFSLLGSVMLFFTRFRAFAIFYSLGSVMSILSTLFLMGPIKQMKSMFNPTRLTATIIMLVSLVLTVFFALKEKSLAALMFCIIQFLAMLWYSISYIPFARDAVKKTCSGICL